MSTIKKWILILITILIILAIVLVHLISQNKAEKDINMPDEEPWVPEYNFTQTLQTVEIRNNFYIVQSCIERFFTYYSEMFKDIETGYITGAEGGTTNSEQIQKSSIEKVYNMLDEEYLNYKEITLENLTTKLLKINEVAVNIENMYYVEKNQNISAYFVYGTLKDILDSKTTDFSMMIKVDAKNKTYKLLLGDYVEKNYKDIKIGDYIEINDTEIKNDLYNTYSYKHISDEEYINDLIIHYKRKLRTSKEETYELLNGDYKTQCFNNLNDYLSYINENYSKIITAKIDTYSKEKNGNYTQYLLKDTKDNYYIFKEIAPFQYTVLLDNYTIPTDDFIQTYNESTEVEKVVLNIKRFFMGIDDKNYGYSYSVLSESFKGNKYPTKDAFVQYAKQNFFEENEIEYISCEKQNGLYIYKIKTKDATGKNTETKSLNMIVKLNNGTDFEMSFGM